MTISLSESINHAVNTVPGTKLSNYKKNTILILL